MRKRLVPILLLGAGAVLLAGCSSFHSEWDAALKQPIPADGISGPWEGRWISAKNGHNGRLRCVMTPAGPGEYNARFHAVYWKIFRFGYSLPLRVHETNGMWEFKGGADLGWLAGGVYTCDGSATADEFLAEYESKYDRGEFQMTRPKQRD